ncbi:MAG: hypothetical protein KGL39_26425 [Patescibacteria group bacterium]|nr:hypothetical protein [Patescibacteria group bacterium]
MKKQLTFLAILAAVAAIFSCSAKAQTNTPATFFTSAESYLTSFNTNYTFDGVTLEMSTGYKQVTGINAASFVDAQYNFANGLNIDASIQFSGVGSPINAFQAGIGYNVIKHYDCEVNAVVLAGYDDVKSAGVYEPGLTLKKKLTPNTFAELGISLPIYSTGSFNRNPTFRVGTGFTF